MFFIILMFFIMWYSSGSIWLPTCIYSGFFILYFIIVIISESTRRANIRGLNCFDLSSVGEFDSFRRRHGGFAGVYVLINKKNNYHYVGQSVDVISRVSSHFQGRGNGDVYADFKYGCPFEVILIPLQEPFNTLNELEREMIRYYGADRQYNKTKGNRG